MEWVAFTDYLASLSLDQRTIIYYVRHARNATAWLQPRGSDLDGVNATLLAEWARTLPNSHSTRGQVAAALRHYWEWTGRVNPPGKAIRVPPRPEMVCRTLEDDESSLMEKMAQGWWPQGAAVMLGLYLGIRRFEIAKAEWSRFDDRMQWYRVTGKRSKTATLPVEAELRAELVPHRATGWIFPGRFGGHVNPATIGVWIEQVGEAAGIGHIVPHRLRHTALTKAVDAGVPIRDVQTFARHSDPAMTSRYTRTTQNNLRAVARAIKYRADSTDLYRLGSQPEED